MFLAACGVKGATVANQHPGDAGSAPWWAKQKLHHTVNFGNWPYYIDVLSGKHPTLEHFTQTTGIQVNYTEPINNNLPFYAKIRPSLQAKQSTGYDIIVMTNNSPALGYLINYGWLTPLDQSAMPNFHKYAGPLVKNPSWDRGNKYTMAWQSGWTAIGYNSSMIKNPGNSVRHSVRREEVRRQGRHDVRPPGARQPRAARDRDRVRPPPPSPTGRRRPRNYRQQKSDGIVRAYYDQDYINALKNGDTLVFHGVVR